MYVIMWCLPASKLCSLDISHRTNGIVKRVQTDHRQSGDKIFRFCWCKTIALRRIFIHADGSRVSIAIILVCV